MSKFKLTQTATEVQDILNNSLQKPTGLTKTKLVGVGVNGQENIEIGDNLTLANGKLSATGSLPSTVEFDSEGNRTVGKDLGVDGKLKLKSLVSTSNPDGDITKELGGGGGAYAWEVIKYLSPRIAAKEYSIGEEIDMGDARVKLDGSELSVMIHYPVVFDVDGVKFTCAIAFNNDYPTKYVIAYVYCIKPGTVTHATEYSLKIVANKQK